MLENNPHLRTLGPAPSSSAAEAKENAARQSQPPAPELPADYFRALLMPRCKRDGICDNCGMCMH